MSGMLQVENIHKRFGKREVLHDLSVAYDRILKEAPESEALQHIQRSQTNLLRRWGQV